MPGPVELIPGTALPMYAPETARQPEGRGGIQLTDARQPPSMIENVPEDIENVPEDGDEISRAHHQLVQAAIRSFDRAAPRAKTYYPQSSDQTDGTTGNLVLQLFEVPAGMEGRITNVIVDAPDSATINPSAPFANAACWAFIAVGPPTSTDNDGLADSLRNGMVAFAPTSAAGPILPGQWTFNDPAAPVAYGGEMFYYCVHGGSIAAILNLKLRVRSRINLYSHA